MLYHVLLSYIATILRKRCQLEKALDIYLHRGHDPAPRLRNCLRNDLEGNNTHPMAIFPNGCDQINHKKLLIAIYSVHITDSVTKPYFSSIISYPIVIIIILISSPTFGPSIAFTLHY